MALDEDEYSSCVIDCLDYGDQTTARESAEIGEDVSEEAGAFNEVRDNSANQLFDTSCTICATGLPRTHELTKCSGRQLTNKRTK